MHSDAMFLLQLADLPVTCRGELRVVVCRETSTGPSRSVLSSPKVQGDSFGVSSLEVALMPVHTSE